MTNGRKKKKRAPKPNRISSDVDVESFPMDRPSFQQSITLWRSCSTASIVVAATTPIFGVIDVALNQVDGYTGITQLFDEYKLLKCEVTFMPSANVAYGGQSAGVLLTAIDWDDGTTPTTLADLRKYSTCQQTRATQSHRRTYALAIADTIYGTSTSSGYRRVMSPWINCANVSVNHYGLKYGLTGGGNAMTVDLEVRVLIAAHISR